MNWPLRSAPALGITATLHSHSKRTLDKWLNSSDAVKDLFTVVIDVDFRCHKVSLYTSHNSIARKTNQREKKFSCR